MAARLKGYVLCRRLSAAVLKRPRNLLKAARPPNGAPFASCHRDNSDQCIYQRLENGEACLRRAAHRPLPSARRAVKRHVNNDGNWRSAALTARHARAAPESDIANLCARNRRWREYRHRIIGISPMSASRRHRRVCPGDEQRFGAPRAMVARREASRL